MLGLLPRVVVELSSIGDGYLAGFLMKVKHHQRETVGHFGSHQSEAVQGVCGSVSRPQAATHTSSQAKGKVEVRWTGPPPNVTSGASTAPFYLR